MLPPINLDKRVATTDSKRAVSWPILAGTNDLRTSLSPPGQQFASVLIDFGRLRGVHERGGTALRLSQDELGAVLGVSRQSINKELRQSKQVGGGRRPLQPDHDPRLRRTTRIEPE